MSTRSSPACGTCRKKCRKCDRARPYCKRCSVKGLVCEGYPPRFKIYDLVNGSGKPRPKARAQNPAKKRRKESPYRASTSPPFPLNASVRSSDGSQTGDFDQSPAANRCSSTTGQLATDCPVYFPSPSPQLDDILSQPQTHELLIYFDVSLCDNLGILTAGCASPFRTFILPLAYQHTGLLHAVLGLADCHSGIPNLDGNREGNAAHLEHKLLAIQSLAELLLKEECFGLNDSEEEICLAIVLILVLHDICESGKSLHGTHLNGVAFLCNRIVARPTEHAPLKTFLIATLSWLDILRGFTGAEKLAFAPRVRQWVIDADDFSLETIVGCPSELFHIIGTVLEDGKAYLLKELPLKAFEDNLSDAEDRLRQWDPTHEIYPSLDPEWQLLAEAYRHACILRVLRFPDTFGTPCTNPKIRSSVEDILEACAQIPWTSPLYKRTLFPLFMAGADTISLHQQHYVRLCINEIQCRTGFPQPAVLAILNTVWLERSKVDQSAEAPANIPWMECTCSISLRRQHDYLFF